MVLREYMSSDCEHLAELFYQTVHTVIAVENEIIVGFGENPF